MGKIESFEDLNAWKKGHELVLMVYEEIKMFPKEERYALGDQLRRSIVSVTSNICEGFSRQTNKEKIQFYYIALGSLSESKNQLLIARDLGYIESKIFDLINDKSVVVSKLTNGLIKSLKRNNEKEA